MEIKTEVKVDLDTRKAKQQARELSRARVRSKRKQTTVANRRTPISGKLTQLAGGAAAYAGVNRILHGSGAQPSPWDAWKRPVAAVAQRFIDEHVGYSAKARMTSLDRTEKRLAFATGEHGSLAPARAFFGRDNIMQQQVEDGRQVLRADPRFAGVNLIDLLKQSVNGYIALLGKSFGYIMETFGK